MGRVNQSTRKQVYERDGHQCVHCGTMTGLSLQHRAGAGMGGSKTLHSASNLVVMCLRSNQLLEADAEFAQEGRDRGWKLRRYQNPMEVPVWYEPDGDFFYLDEKGERHRV